MTITNSTLYRDPAPPATLTETSPVTIPDGTLLISSLNFNNLIDLLNGTTTEKIEQTAINGLVTALAGKSATGHTHAQSEITNLVVDLAAKAPLSHTHAQSEITNLVTDLANKANLTHSHVIADITGLQAALDGKQDALGFTAENTSNKGTANGYAPLDGNSRVPIANLGSGTPDGTKFLRDDGTLAVPPGGSGEANTVTNTVPDSSTEKGLAKTKTGVDIPMKVLKAGTDVALAEDADSVTITSTAVVQAAAIRQEKKFLSLKPDEAVTDAVIALSNADRDSATDSWSLGTAGRRDWLAKNNISRCRYSGTAYGFNIRTGSNGDVSSITEVRIRIWRKNGSGNYDLVSESENFATHFVANYTTESVYHYDFTTPLTDIQMGDYVGIVVDATQALTTLFRVTNGFTAGSIRSYVDYTGPLTNVDFDGQASSHSPLFSLQLVGTPPWAVWLQGSHGVGASSVSATYRGFFTDTVDAMDTTRMPAGICEPKLGRNIANCSQGSSNSTVQLIIDNFQSKIAEMKPRVCIMYLGNHDIGGGTTVGDFTTRIAQLYSQINALGIKIIIGTVTPITTHSESQRETAERFNDIMRAECNRYGGLVIDTDAIGLGVRKPGVNQYNLWNLNPTYDDGDTVHLTKAGYEFFADGIMEAIRSQSSYEIGTSATISLSIAASDETTVLNSGSNKVKTRMPFGFTVTEVRASLSTAGTGAALLTVDVNKNGTSILSPKITFDAGESTSKTAATQPVVSDPILLDDDEITVDIDQIDTDNVAAGLKVHLIGYRS